MTEHEPGTDVTVTVSECVYGNTTEKVAFFTPAAKFPTAASEASNTTVPAPVKVTVFAEIVAGPLTTE